MRKALRRIHSPKLAVLVCLLGTAVSFGDVLNVNQKNQEKTQWCWAASCQAVLEFYGLAVTQTNIAVYGTGGNNVWNYLWGSGDPGDGIFRRGCDLILNNFGGVSGHGFTGLLTLPQLQAEVNGARPVVVNWAWDGGGGHILVVRGVVSSNVYLMDPWYGASVNDYAWVCKGGGHTWQWTIQISTASAATNGVPRWWLGMYNLTNNWQWDAMALGDQDGDGARTWEEFIADTVPTNGSSRFALRIMSVAGDPANAALTWPSSTNRQYSLQRTTNLQDVASWTDVPGLVNVNGTGSVMAFTNGTTAGAEFFSGRVSLKP